MTPAATSVNEAWLWVFCYSGLRNCPSDSDRLPRAMALTRDQRRPNQARSPRWRPFLAWFMVATSPLARHAGFNQVALQNAASGPSQAIAPADPTWRAA